MKETMQNKRLELMIGIAEKELSGLTSIHNELSSTLGEKLMDTIDLIEKVDGNVVLSGIGKSGMIANKIAATLTSTGTSSFFLHGTEASHGDLGLLKENDILFLISNSGETVELRNIVLFAKKNNIKIISITANKESHISKQSDISIVLPNFVEACPHDLAPTTSTTMQLALGDIIAITLMTEKGISKDDFKSLHPSGKIGARLSSVQDVMHTGDAIPLANQDTSISEALVIMTKKRFGCIGLTDTNGILAGIITDGDLRRCLSGNILGRESKDIMTKKPVTISNQMTVSSAISLMNNKKITSLFVLEDGKPEGIVHLHDLINISAL